MKEIVFRKGTAKDLSEIMELRLRLADYESEVSNDYYSDRKVKMKIDEIKSVTPKFLKGKNSLIFVAEKGGKIVGMMMASIEPRRASMSSHASYRFKKTGFIYDAFIESKYRKLGIGKRLLELTMDWFKKNKIRYVHLDVLTRNRGAVAAWQKLGFKEINKNMRYDL